MRRVIALLLFCSFAAPAAAQTRSPFRISVDVIGEDNTADMELEADSYLCRKLQSLGDVEVVDTKPKYSIHAVVQKAKTSGSDRIPTIAISLITLHHLAPGKSGVEVVSHALWIGDQNSLRKKCEEYITQIDSGILEPQRKRSRGVPNP